MTITAAAISIINIDFADIIAAGAAIPWTGTSVGNCQNNTNITFSTSRSIYAVGAGSFSTTVGWSTISGGSSGQNPPLPQDNVFMDGNSPAGTYTMDAPRLCANFTCTGFTRTLTMTSGLNYSIYGNVTLGSGMMFNNSGSSIMILAGRGNYTLTTNGISIPYYLSLTCVTGTYTLGSALAIGGPFNFISGGINTANYSVSSSNITGTSGNVRTMTLGSTVWTCTGNWNMNSGNITLNAGTSTIIMVTSGDTFTGGSLAYNNLTFQANSSFTVAGTNSFNTVTIPASTYITWPASTTNTIAKLVAMGQNNGFEVLPGASGNYVSAPAAAALEISNGTITLDACISLTSFSVQQAIIGRWNASSTYNYLFYTSATGGLHFNYALTSGASGTAIVSTVTLASAGYSVNQTFWVRVSVSGGSANFYTSPTGDGAWTQLGTTLTGLSTTWGTGGTQPLEIGSTANGTANLLTGNVYRARVYSTALGSTTGTSPIFDANFTTKAFGSNSFTESSSNAATVTINGVVAQAGDGRVQMVSSTPGTQATINSPNFISGNYLVLQDSQAAGANLPFYAGDQSVNVSNNTNWSFVDGTLNTLTAGLSASGSVIKTTSRHISGGLGSAGSMALTLMRALTGNLGGTGVFAKSTTNQLSGVLTKQGSLNRRSSRAFNGNLDLAGTIIRNTVRSLGGTLATAGATGLQTTRDLMGSISATGSIVKSTLASLTGSLISGGSINRFIPRYLFGNLNVTGNTQKFTNTQFQGVLGSGGSVVKITARSLVGNLISNGVIGKVATVAFNATLNAFGTIQKTIAHAFNAALNTLGTVQKTIARTLTGIVGMVGVVIIPRVYVVNIAAQLGLSGTLDRFFVFIDWLISRISPNPYTMLRNATNTFLTNRTFSWGTSDEVISESSIVASNSPTFVARNFARPDVFVEIVDDTSNAVEVDEDRITVQIQTNQLVLRMPSNWDTLV
jgi:hypothetical protein